MYINKNYNTNSIKTRKKRSHIRKQTEMTIKPQPIIKTTTTYTTQFAHDQKINIAN